MSQVIAQDEIQQLSKENVKFVSKINEFFVKSRKNASTHSQKLMKSMRNYVNDEIIQKPKVK